MTTEHYPERVPSDLQASSSESDDVDKASALPVLRGMVPDDLTHITEMVASLAADLLSDSLDEQELEQVVHLASRYWRSEIARTVSLGRLATNKKSIPAQAAAAADESFR